MNVAGSLEGGFKVSTAPVTLGIGNKVCSDCETGLFAGSGLVSGTGGMVSWEMIILVEAEVGYAVVVIEVVSNGLAR